jgi:hypothetical protein
MMSSPFRALAIAASALVLSAAAGSFGPPWISIETPPNPYDAASRGAFLVVHTFHHGQAVASGVTGTAEGIVGGARRSMPLSFDTTSRPGTYALRKQWPSEGIWMLVISTGGQAQGITALVDIDPSGDAGRVRVPTRRSGQWELPVQVTARDITAALEARAGTARTAAR